MVTSEFSWHRVQPNYCSFNINFKVPPTGYTVQYISFKNLFKK